MINTYHYIAFEKEDGHGNKRKHDGFYLKIN